MVKNDIIPNEEYDMFIDMEDEEIFRVVFYPTLRRNFSQGATKIKFHPENLEQIKKDLEDLGKFRKLGILVKGVLH